jgi:hypothetical protein
VTELTPSFIGAFCPYLHPSRRKRLHGAVWRVTWLGLERRCARCGEFWPADTEFWHPLKRADHIGLHSWCRACYGERKYQAGRAAA